MRRQFSGLCDANLALASLDRRRLLDRCSSLADSKPLSTPTKCVTYVANKLGRITLDYKHAGNHNPPL
jgi:hypothetical protein